MKNLTFHGIDASNEISLLEYGLLVSDQLHEDGSGTRFCVFKFGENLFDTGHIKEEELNRIARGEDWASAEDCKSFLSYVGCSINEWVKMDFVNKLYDLISYWGSENIMGSSYMGMTEDEAKQRYL